MSDMTVTQLQRKLKLTDAQLTALQGTVGTPTASRVLILDADGNTNYTGVGSTKTVRQTAQFDATSSTTGTTFTNLTGMVQTVVPGTYSYTVRLPGISTTNSGMRAAFKYTGTVLSSIQNTVALRTSSNITTANSTSTTDQANLGGATAAIIYLVLEGSFVVTTGGTIQVQAAQNASHADTTSVYVGATFNLTRIA
jgi:hypothetical protein